MIASAGAERLGVRRDPRAQLPEALGRLGAEDRIAGRDGRPAHRQPVGVRQMLTGA